MGISGLAWPQSSHALFSHRQSTNHQIQMSGKDVLSNYAWLLRIESRRQSYDSTPRNTEQKRRCH
eukprot:2312654-Pleurochrysis_carterae.AAC.5